MNHQEMFDIAARGIIAQGGPSVSNGGCRYRSANGRRCAAGFFLTDEVYNVEMEGHNAAFVFNDVEGFNSNDRIFLRKLQRVHDNAGFDCSDAEFFKTWVPRMIEFAKNRRLTVPAELREMVK